MCVLRSMAALYTATDVQALKINRFSTNYRMTCPNEGDKPLRHEEGSIFTRISKGWSRLSCRSAAGVEEPRQPLTTTRAQREAIREQSRAEREAEKNSQQLEVYEHDIDRKMGQLWNRYFKKPTLPESLPIKTQLDRREELYKALREVKQLNGLCVRYIFTDKDKYLILHGGIKFLMLVCAIKDAETMGDRTALASGTWTREFRTCIRDLSANEINEVRESIEFNMNADFDERLGRVKNSLLEDLDTYQRCLEDVNAQRE